jgi:putative hydrolase
MNQDLHLHSNYSDGVNSLEEMIKCAIILGINRICFTDHVWKTSDWTEKYLLELENLKENYRKDIEIVSGVEAKLLNLDGELDVSDDLCTKEIRIVGAMHRIPIGNNKFIRRSEIKQDLEYSKKSWLRAFEAFCFTRKLDCIAHPFSLLEPMEINKDDLEWWETVSKILNKNSVQIEFNVKYDNSIVPEWFWRNHEQMIVPASDSHSVKDLQKRFKEIAKLNMRIK